MKRLTNDEKIKRQEIQNQKILLNLQKTMFKAIEKYVLSLGKNKKELKSKINYIKIEKNANFIKLTFNVNQVVLGVNKTKDCTLTLNYTVFQHIENKVFALFSNITVLHDNIIQFKTIEKTNITKNNKSEIMKAAHKLAKEFTGNYSARLSLALKTIYQEIKNNNQLKVA